MKNLVIPVSLKKKREIKIKRSYLINFEDKIKNLYEAGKIRGPIHLSSGNENFLIDIFKYIDRTDFVFSAWRNHYHAILHGINAKSLTDSIVKGKSMGVISKKPFFYSSSIVGGIIPIALGVALGLKQKNNKSSKVWCFIGDMTMETGQFYEAYKYSQNNNLPIQFVVEDNDISVHTPTKSAWGKKMKIPKNVIYYFYKNKYPHHGTGKWVNF